MRKQGWWRLLALLSSLHFFLVAALLYQALLVIPPSSPEQEFRAKASMRLLMGRGDLSPYADIDRRYRLEGHVTDAHIASLLNDSDQLLISEKYAEHLAERQRAVTGTVLRHAARFALPVLFCVVLMYAVPWVIRGFRQ